jgi:hypothetical protein
MKPGGFGLARSVQVYSYGHRLKAAAMSRVIVATLQKAGKVYVHTAIDCRSCYNRVRLCSPKLPVTAVLPAVESKTPGSRWFVPTMARNTAPQGLKRP